MRKLEDILKSAGKGVALSSDEKKEIGERLKAYASFHPVRNEVPERLYRRRSPFSVLYYSLQIIVRKRIMPIFLIIALMLGGGGVSYAAEGAVPGDALYQVKVNVNEEVRDLIARTPEAKATWETERVTRRLLEAEELAKDGVLAPEAQQKIEEKIAEHIGKIEDHLSKVEERKNISEASRIATSLETTLRAHAEVLTRIQEVRDESALSTVGTAGADSATTAESRSFEKDRLGSITIKIAEHAEKIAIRRDAELSSIAFQDAPGRKVAAEEQRKHAEKKMGELSVLFDARKESLSENARRVFEGGIADAKDVYNKGLEAVATEKYEEAMRAFQETGMIANKLTVYLKSERDLGVTVTEKKTLERTSVTMKREDGGTKEVGGIPTDLMPIVHTDQVPEGSRKELAEAMLRKAGVYKEEVIKLFEMHRASLPEYIATRIKGGIATAEETLLHGMRALEAGEYGTAYLSAQKAVNLLGEIAQVIRKYVTSDGDGNTSIAEEVHRAHTAAEGALAKAKEAIATISAESENANSRGSKVRALYEEAAFTFAKGVHAENAGAPKEAIELFHKTVRIVEEIMKLVRGEGVVVVPSPKPLPVPEPIVCTKEYAPVCASVNTGIVCIKAPCPTTTEKTFGNACEARAAGATVVYKGECRPSVAQCDYAAPPQGCEYVKGSAYNETTRCGLVLKCPTTPTVKCEYAAPIAGCEYIHGPSYNEVTGCGLVLKCATESLNTSTLRAQEVPATNTTEVKTEETKTDTTRAYTY
ncbi:MAG: hypothetical protein A3J08_01530 [Candidatus Lloydbacteria bacterium RIFCSPLOWO2_02_FULL_51_11]|uniref:DUF5667 domain-containing protein n=1 Tax=Candidatus Lloydbacteria bacterium RIFCSPLOWO2_02_FULL_51_11 TaxID=1798667 RepID=A0A1G2DNQ3_9BACT|nr:MAG: hypothetical protein A3J08_01530 [Candidatus Lloydbacteria bacterium RIFCSPLOWO2_02_FULL_51_11]